jgi:hypothetical protein
MMLSQAEQFAAMIVGLEDHGMKPVEIMRATGVKKSTYYRIRSGEARQPAYASIQPIERLFENLQTVPPLGIKMR